jgi:hypothetical protein
MRKIGYVMLAVGLAAMVAAAACTRWFKSSDEGPIIVGNGSMTIDTANDAKWGGDKEDSAHDQWSNETGKNHGGDLWVYVYFKGTPPTLACSGQGTPVEIYYTPGSFKAKFDVVGNGSSTRTKVSPKGQIDKRSEQRLEYGAHGVGYIDHVEIHNQRLPNCDITITNLDSIHICSTGDVKKCK